MFRHYLKIAFRNIWKHKTQSLTAIFGLAFAIACFVPALYWFRYETSYDSFYPDAEHIYRIHVIEEQSGKVNELVPGVLSNKLHEHFPGTENSTYFISEINNCKTEHVPHIGLRTLITDSSFFRVFKQEFVSGDAMQPLHIMNNIVLTESMAIGLFGDVEKAIGQQIQSTFYFFSDPYTVTAVVKDPPSNTNLPFDALLLNDYLLSMLGAPEEYQWIECTVQLYVKLHSQTDAENLAEQIRDLPSQLNAKPSYEVRMVPVSDVRHQLNSDIPFTMNFIQLFVAAGILLLFSAIFNFLNLHLNLFHQRNRELHQRAVHGAKSKQLISQMLFELTCSILLALLIGGCLVLFARPVFSKLLDLAIERWPLIQLFIICGVSVTVLVLSLGFIIFWRLKHLALQPLSKGKTTGKPLLKGIAVTLQLAVSIVFIIATLVVMMQIQFVNHKDLGFNRSGTIQLHGLPPYMQNNVRTALIQELQTIPQIRNISRSNFIPQHHANTMEMTNIVEWPGKLKDDNPTFNIIPTDQHFSEIFGLKMLAGEWYKEGGGQNVVLNEEAVRVMGLKDPIGTNLRISIYNIDMEIAKQEYDVEYKVVGVVNDFHTLSLRSRIHPTIFRYIPTPKSRMVDNNILYISVTPGQEQEAIERIAAILPNVDPSFADLKLTTLDNLYDNFNHSEQVGLKMFSVLAMICLLISLFGIYAVASASTQRRRKEIAIRKVVGAKASDIIRIFFREYSLQVIIASVFALPLAYLAMSRWLQGYAYRTDIPWWLLAGVMIGVVAVVLLTVLGQVLRAARSNPAEVVKSE
ncbi:putative ABC transport system permease protein [Parabacteroides sp. PF5-5]|uniref:ABC transporter permease n=1 Tax=unclassified Parabacteroides TaxID=2649774 RepID=UPI002473C22A|nr:MULTISPECIES: ABC transporter permease [unclassified Parabacteroides]MDH6303504.1 putative ABC transport system permease protein [Parabacteroides sp. PH5-39]MDH6314826.1 putative ABC transport system permease protein [Parabacteroides sp. PF5-13]MDH6318163.1 putative ABC transport system permease protein [Parabacteroides sp. PH5-13]MDH6321905.1 putative ABC transport system permease protein [Parabacteroides sp. PH5-8]MDH6326029.1 putative ABC transport system permease protein [Parabacteroide